MYQKNNIFSTLRREKIKKVFYFFRHSCIIEIIYIVQIWFKEILNLTLYSPLFLLSFLPVSATVYNRLPKRAKTVALCVLNVLFYAFAAGKYFIVLPLLALVVYPLSFIGKKGAYICLALLPVLRILGVGALGTSFFILRAAGYIYDGNREKNFLKVFAFLTFFPCVHAGPLAKYSDAQKDFERDRDYSRVSRGILLVLAGALKKLFFADALFASFEQFFAGATSLSALLALLSYSLYIYFDFSGCSDMARGVALMFGFGIPKNFDFPYMSKSVGEFFRRWHITLGRWLFDYVYLPLGGSRHGKTRTAGSLFAVWLASALWHGFTSAYLAWGVYFFLICTFEKLILKKSIGRLSTLLLVLFGWVFFFSENVSQAAAFFCRLFALGDTLLYCRGDIYNCLRSAPFMLLAAACATPLFHNIFCAAYQKARFAVYVCAPIAVVLILSCLALGGHKPFLYATF